ncbi:MAG TPA: hypothetical protein VN363_01475, partial [Anaerolineales bacterium]|nr:hypothetical protein [Anaerolineales bacterium]
MTNEPLRMQILNMIERGDISTGEGLRWLEALAKNQPTSASRGELDSDMPEADPDLPEPDFPDVETGAEGVAATILPPPSADHLPFDTARIRGWWVVPLWIGVGVTVLAGLLMYWANLSQGIGFWFACASVPFILGLLLIVLAVQSRTARWLYLRVEQPGTEWPRVIQFG